MVFRSRRMEQSSCRETLFFLMNDMWRCRIVDLGHVGHRVTAANLELIETRRLLFHFG